MAWTTLRGAWLVFGVPDTPGAGLWSISQSVLPHRKVTESRIQPHLRGVANAENQGTRCALQGPVTFSFFRSLPSQPQGTFWFFVFSLKTTSSLPHDPHP